MFKALFGPVSSLEIIVHFHSGDVVLDVRERSARGRLDRALSGHRVRAEY